jgi:SPRY domain-containing SOCS box protein 3
MSSPSSAEDARSWPESVEHVPHCEWRWNEKDCGRDLVIHKQKLGVTFHPVKSSGCVVVRGEKVLRPNMEHYFEVELKGPFHGKARQVGVGTKHTALQSNNCDFYPLIGKDLSSWGVNYDGFKSNASNKERHVSISPEKHDIIKVSVHYDSYYGTVAFEVNGKSSGLAYERVHTNIDMYPMLCASAANTQMRLVYASSSVLSLRAIARGTIRSSMAREKDIEKLTLPTHLKSYLLYRSKAKGNRKKQAKIIEQQSHLNSNHV